MNIKKMTKKGLAVVLAAMFILTLPTPVLAYQEAESSESFSVYIGTADFSKTGRQTFVYINIYGDEAYVDIEIIPVYSAECFDAFLAMLSYGIMPTMSYDSTRVMGNGTYIVNIVFRDYFGVFATPHLVRRNMMGIVMLEFVATEVVPAAHGVHLQSSSHAIRSLGGPVSTQSQATFLIPSLSASSRTYDKVSTIQNSGGSNVAIRSTLTRR